MLVRKLNKVMQMYDTQIVYPVELDTDEINLFVVKTSSRGEIFTARGPSGSSVQCIVRNTEALRELLLSSDPTPWDRLVLPSSGWASCVMELLQIEHVCQL